MSTSKRRSLSFRSSILAVALAIGTGLATPVFAADAGDQPGAVISGLDQSLLDVMQHAKQLGYDGRYAKLEPVLRQTFDIPYMTRIAVGPGWSTLSADQQAQLSDAFGKFIVSTYARRFDGYSGEKFEMVGERPIGQATLVQTKLVKSDGEPVALSYVARQDAGQWHIVDVYLTGSISELAQRRSELSSVFARNGFGGLLTTLQQKVAQAENEGRVSSS
jgi:phospholipid transport system substrate-binding protein